MKHEYLPTEDDSWYIMWAGVNRNNEVVWTGSTDAESIPNVEYALFRVFRNGPIVIVEANTWFDFRLELTELPDRVVILAQETMALYERAHDEESPLRG